MAHESYRLYEGHMGTRQVDLPPLEHFIGSSEAIADSPTRFLAAMTIRQVADSCAAMRSMGLDPNVWGQQGQVSLIGDNSVIPIIDGKPQYQGAPDVNDDWRVAIQVDTGGRLAEFAVTMAQLAAIRS